MDKNTVIDRILEGISEEDLMFDDLAFAVIEEIHAMMERKNISQKKLAEKLGVTTANISKQLSGDNNLTLKSIARICVALTSKPHFKLSSGDEIQFIRKQAFTSGGNWKKQTATTMQVGGSRELPVAA